MSNESQIHESRMAMLDASALASRFLESRHQESRNRANTWNNNLKAGIHQGEYLPDPEYYTEKDFLDLSVKIYRKLFKNIVEVE